MLRKLLLGLLLAASSITGFANPQASNGKDSVELTAKSCTDAQVLSFIPAPLRGDFFTADVYLHGVHYKPCWTNIGENIVLVYPDGDQGQLPVSLFKEAGI